VGGRGVGGGEVSFSEVSSAMNEIDAGRNRATHRLEESGVLLEWSYSLRSRKIMW
jgi:hypothetical protein